MEFKRLNILLADDDEDDRMIFTDALAELKVNVNVQTVSDGEKLMKHLNTTNQELPDILFLDLNMPIKNGIECLVEIRNSTKLKDLNVVIYSTSTSDVHIEATFAKGANLYIAKPTAFGTLTKTLTQVISIDWQERAKTFSRKTFLFRL